MPSGRLTDLTPELIEKAQSYLGTCVMKIPSIEGLSLYLKVSRASVYNWADAGSKEDATEEQIVFLDTYEEIMSERAERLQNGGLYNKFNPTITKLLLSSVGYIEKQETDITSKGESVQQQVLPQWAHEWTEELKKRSKDEQP